MQRPMRMRVLVVAVVGACGFAIATLDDMGTGGDVPGDAYVPDAGACQTASSSECVGPTLRVCTTVGQLPIDQPCAWGCSSLGAAHCARLQPHGGGVTAADLDPTAELTSITLTDKTISSDTGEISGGIRGPGVGVISGIEFHVRNGVGIFRFNKVRFENASTVIGTNAVAFVSITRIDTAATIDVRGGCQGSNAGPGGRAGGDIQQNGPGPGGGVAGTGSSSGCTGGGGGGLGSVGGNGGNVSNAGGIAGDLSISTLYGGGGGGGGGGATGARGGGGGGAIQLVANATIHIEGLGFIGGINAGGCGGKNAELCGGGGGAGGTILIEAPIIELTNSILAVNGGGGGGSKFGQAGQDARLGASKALGGAGGAAGGGHLVPDGQGEAGGKGGDGGARGALAGNSGVDVNMSGAGGGGVGRIRFYTYSGSVTINAGTTLSPSLFDVNTTTTRAVAAVE